MVSVMRIPVTAVAAQSTPATPADASAVAAFWAASSTHWFEKDAGFDHAFRERFLGLHMDVAARKHDGWMASSDGALALLILTDQFPRNAFRGAGHMYATDPLARLYARQALEAGYMDDVEPEMRLFFCLPFAHSEDMEVVHTITSIGQARFEHIKRPVGAHDRNTPAPKAPDRRIARLGDHPQKPQS